MKSGIKKEGWIYVVQWANDGEAVKIGFTTDLKQRLVSFLTVCRHKLIVLKAFKANQEEEFALHARFDGCRDNGEWFHFSPGIRRFLKEEVICQTHEAKKAFGGGYGERIIWRPLSMERKDSFRALYKEQRLPRFVKTARDYVLWAIEDLRDKDYFCTSSAIINHDANQHLYEAKTVYNTLAALIVDGLVEKDSQKYYCLTDEGEMALLTAEDEMAKQRQAKRSVRSLRPGKRLHQ